MSVVTRAARIARRELRGGLRGFRIFLICLALGVAAIAAVGSVGHAIEEGLKREGASLLGGDGELELTYRFADATERAWLEARADAVSEVVDFRSMAVVGEERALTQVKGVDAAYPLKGQVVIAPEIPLATALAGQGDTPGAVMHRVLVDRMGLSVGDLFRLGEKEFLLMAVLVSEPDDAASGFALGPRTLVATPALEGTGLVQPGSLFDTKYRLDLPDGADLEALESEAMEVFREAGGRWRDSRNGAPGVQRFVERLGAFLTLVGLAGLAVGGVGVSAAVRAYLSGKTQTIATLKTVGADRATIFLAYVFQIGVLTVLGLVLGLALGAMVPVALAPIIAEALPVPAVFSIYPGPLAEAALYGALAAALFTLWPLARTEDVRPAALFRDITGRARTWPRARYLVLSAFLLTALVGAAALFSGIPTLALWTAAGILGALVILALAAQGLRALARRLGKTRALRGRTALRAAMGAIGGPREEAGAVVLSLGLGLAVLAAVGQVESNLRTSIARDLPEVAPSYFFVDIQNDQLEGFRARLDSDADVSRVQTAPMMRGVITRINGTPSEEFPDHWVLRGDRGITYANELTEGTEVVAGSWWPKDYDGPPQISFAAEEAEEIGLKLGDMITVNILGRDIEAEITSLREVDFSNAGIGFVLTLNANAVAGAPHTHIATVYADETAEAQILRDLAKTFPNITAIRVRDAIDRVAAVLGGLAAAISYGALATLVTGFVVLIGAAAAGESARTYEAAVLKTLGASRATILTSFALRSAFLGAAAGLVALAAGIGAGWAVISYVMDVSFEVAWGPAIAIVLGGILVSLLAGLGFAWRPLAARPAQVLRARE